MPRLYACICAIAKDEEPEDLLEWVWYHLGLGFERAVVYDNGSCKAVSELLAPLVAAGLGDVVDFPLREAPQLSAYYHALQTWRGRCRWLAFLDIDEFFVLCLPGLSERPAGQTATRPDIREILESYENFAALAAHWLLMNSAGHLQRPSGGVLRNYSQALGLDAHVKSLVCPEKTLKPLSPHHFSCMPGFCTVNEDGFPVGGALSYPTARLLRVNHYYYKSQQDFEAKIRRGLATRVAGVERDLNTFYEHCRRDWHFDSLAQSLAAPGARLATMPPERAACLVLAKEARDAAEFAGAQATEEKEKRSPDLPCSLRRQSGPPPAMAGLLHRGVASSAQGWHPRALAQDVLMGQIRELWLQAESWRNQGEAAQLRAHASQKKILGFLADLYARLGLSDQAEAVRGFLV